MKKIMSYLSFSILSAGMLSSCGDNPNVSGDIRVNPGISQAKWGNTNGKDVLLYTLVNNKGDEVKITNYGGIITSWITVDKNGNKSNIVVGFDSLEGYFNKHPFFGATVGRYANRIANGKFTLDGTTYKLAANNGKNALHGGLKGFDKVVWDVAPINDSVPSLSLSYVSKDGEEGYPGNLKVNVVFTFTNDNELQIDYAAETDKPTVINLTNHSYFNLTGDISNTILNHSIKINADKFTPVDETLIPTGELKDVAGTPFDFTTAHKVGERIEAAGGYDHNFILNGAEDAMKQAAVLTDSTSGRQLEVFTNQPGMQFYTGNFLNGSMIANDGKPVNKNTALCLETQHFPDSPNQSSFPSTVLRPDKKYATTTKYKVSLLP